MKRYFYLAAAIAGLLMAASCQKESFGSLDGNYTDMLFTTEIPSGVATKAIADGLTVNKLYYEVYEVTEANGTEELAKNPVFDNSTAISNGSATISVRLQKNKKYTAIFWAQYEQESTPQDGESQSSPYNVEDLRSIKVSYKDALANDETRDAFYAVVPNVESRTTAYDVTLKRPFAQVNVATSDFEVISTNNVTSSLTITNVADTFYPLTNEASVLGDNSELSATFGATYIPNEFLTVANNSTTYKYLAMAYVLIPTTSTETSTSISTISSNIWLNSTGTGEPISVSYEGATLKQNHRTNLIGNILTGYTNFNIVVDNEFDNDYTYAVANYEDLKAAITDESKTHKNITLTGDFAADATISIPDGNTIILNLNGKTFTNIVKSGRAFEITGDNVTFTVNAAGSEVIFGGGTTGFIRLKGTAQNAKVTINDGTFTGTSANGTLIRFANQVDNNIVTLNNVNYTENATLNTKETTNSTQNAFVVFAEHYNNMGQNNKLIVNGGTFNCVCGFVTPFASEFNDATIIAKGIGLELKSIAKGSSEPDWKDYSLANNPANHVIKNCRVELAPGAKIDQAPGACIAASYSGIVTVENCTLNAPYEGTYALATWGSGGTITATGCRITSTENGEYKCDKGTITVDGKVVATTEDTPQ